MIIIRVEYEGVRYDLDVLEQTPIRLDISAIENDSIGEVFGAASQQFTLPGSKQNNKFFKHAYKVGVVGVPGLNESVPCWIISDSDTLLEGSLFLDGVVKTKNDGYNYEVTIVNNVITFNETIKTTRVKDLAWSDYDHTFAIDYITASWDDQLFGGDIFYPLLDQGRDGVEGTGSMPNIAWDVEESGADGYINSPSTPIQVQQFTPAVRVRTVLDKIFDAGNFTYETSLTDLLNSVYILPKQTENLSVKGADFADYGFVAEGASAQIVTPGSTNTLVEFPTETYDPTNSFNTTTSTYTVPRNGSYVVAADIVYAFSSALVEGTVRFKMLKNSTVIAETTKTYGGTISGLQTISLSTNTTEGQYIYLNQEDEIKIQITYTASSPYDPNLTLLNYSRFRTLLTPINYEGGTVEMGEQFDPQVKCVDILKGIIEKFNLVFEPDYTKNRVIKIETYDTWVSQGNRKDWTKKIQQAERIFLKSPLSDQPKTIQFEDAKDNDKLSKRVIDNAEGLQWGTSILDAVSDVPQGEKKIGSYFAPVILEKIPGGSSLNAIPQLYKTDDTQVERKTFKFKPRLGYKITGSFGGDAYIGLNASPFSNYATLSNYNELPIVSGSTKNLHWNDTFYTPTFDSTTGTVTAYDQYWNTYVNQLYNDDNKIIRADLYFEPYELRDIKLNDLIYVEDTYYRINKISGYNVNFGDVVSVELISIATGETPSVDINCDFTFEGSQTTTTTTAIPPLKPGTTTLIPPTTTTTTAPPDPESVVFNITNQFTSSVNYSRVVFENNSADLFQYENVPALSTVSTSSVQDLITGSGGTNDIYVSWKLQETGSEKDFVLHSYNSNIYIDGAFAGSKNGSHYSHVTESIQELIYSNANIRTFDSYSVALTLTPYTGTSYIRNLKLDYDNNTEFDVAYSRIKISDNPDNLFKVYDILSGSNVISSSNETLIKPGAANSLTSDFEFDYAGLIDFEFTASLSKDGTPFNTLSGSAFLSQSNQYSVLLDGALDLTADVSYSVDWEINNGTSTTYLYYTNVGLILESGSWVRVGNGRSDVCSQSAIPNDDFAFTTESLGVGVQLYNNPTFTENFQFTTRSEASAFANNNWLKIIKPYSTAPYTGSSYRIDENGVIQQEWPCGYVWVPFKYRQTSNPTSDQLEYSFTTPYNQTYFGGAYGDRSGSMIAEDYASFPPPGTTRDTYFVSLVDDDSSWNLTTQYGNNTELIGSASDETVLETRILLNMDPINKIQTSLDGLIVSGSAYSGTTRLYNLYERLPVFKMISDLTGSSIPVSAFDKYLNNDDTVISYLPDSSSLQLAMISPSDYSRPSTGTYSNGRMLDFSGYNSGYGELNKNTFYSNASANFDYTLNAINLQNNNSNHMFGGVNWELSRQFDVKSLVLLVDRVGTNATSGHYLFDFRDAPQGFNPDWGYIRNNNMTSGVGTMFESASFYVFDELSDTHTSGGDLTTTNFLGTGSTQWPGPGGLLSDYDKRVFTFNFNPNKSFITNASGSNGTLHFGFDYQETNGFRGRIYGAMLFDKTLSFDEHKQITNLFIDRNLISGSIV